MVVSLCLCFLGKDKQKSTPGSNYFSYHLFWFHSRNVKERMPIKKRMRKRKERPPYSLLRSLDFDLSTRSWDLDRHPVVINQYAPDHLMAQDTSEEEKKEHCFRMLPVQGTEGVITCLECLTKWNDPQNQLLIRVETWKVIWRWPY